MEEIRRRLTPQAVKIKAEFELVCYSYNGIEAIKQALSAGMRLNNNEISIKFIIVGSPVYMGMITTKDKTKGIEALEAALKEIEKSIIEAKGTFKIKSPVNLLFNQ